jgi:hypothetical protein
MIEKKSERLIMVKSKDPITVLQISDVHYDSPECDRELITKHLKEAERRGAVVFCNGDWFDLMQGKRDPRGSYSSLLPEYKHVDYLDRVIQDSADFLSKFNVTYIFGRGNHETNITQRMHTDPITSLCMLLRMAGKEAVDVGYDGYINYVISNGSGGGVSCLQYFHHGNGGAAPRSKGIMHADIDQKDAPDADLITKGHDHNKWVLPSPVERINTQSGTSTIKTVYHIRTGSYKKLSPMGWAKEKKFSEPPLGGWWTTFKSGRKKNLVWCETLIEEAK